MIWLFIGVCGAFSCDDDTQTPITTTNNLGSLSQGVDFIIYVRDLVGEPIQGAHITISGREYCTIDDGLVYVTGIDVSVLGLAIDVSAEDFLSKTDVLYSVNQSDNVKEIILLKESDQKVEVNGITAISNRVSVSYPDTLLTPKGEKYFNSLYVIAEVQSRTDESTQFNNIITKSTGDAIGVLESIIDIKFDTYNDFGEELSLRGDTTMTVMIRDLNQTVDSIAYYVENESTGYWEHEDYFRDPNGVGIYSAEISTTSTNIALGKSHGASRLIFQLMEMNTERVLPNVPYQISIAESEYILKNDISDALGYGTAIVPFETDLILTTLINGVKEESSAGRVTLVSDTLRLSLMSESITMSGNVTSCTGETAIGTIVKYTQTGNPQYSYVSDGSFDAIIYNESETTIEAIDIPNGKKTSVETITPTDGYDVGTMSLCEDFVANEVITVSGQISENTTWRNCDLYILDGLVSVTSGVTLTIEKGTLIKAKEASGGQTSGLVIERNAAIEAVGTVDRPIIFTSIVDDINIGDKLGPNLESTENGLWLGIVLLGDSSLDGASSGGSLTGFPTTIDASYGGGATDGDSGELSYVSIRHAGGEVLEGAAYGGLTLAGIGSSTDFSDIEIYGSGNNGLYIIDGSNSLSDILCVDVLKNSIYIDQPWVGTITNSIISLGDNSTTAIALDGDQQGIDTTGVIRNTTIMGSDISDQDFVYCQLGPQMRLEDSYFFNFSSQSDFILSDQESSDMYEAEKLVFENLEIDTSHLLVEISIDDIIIDESSNNVFDTKLPNINLVGQNTVGASKSTFLNWTAADVVGKLERF